VGVLVIVSVVFMLVGNEGPPPFAAAGIRAMFLMLAPLVVGFIAQSTRSEEHRARLLLAGPVTPRQMAGTATLMPFILLAIGIVAAGLVIGIDALLTGKFALETVNIVGFVGGQLFAYLELGLMAQEATAARRERRRLAAAAGWAAFAVAALLLGVLYMALARELLGWSHLILGHLAVGVAAMVPSIELYAGRTDFTR